MTQLLHITDPETWRQSRAAGEYAMSTRGVTLAEQGFIHCSLPHQVRSIADLVYQTQPTCSSSSSTPTG
jgi:uncharacterized protein (DUF952 family)